jgi:hypothetical protein
MYSSKAADIGEDADYDKVIARYRSEGFTVKSMQTRIRIVQGT